MCFCLESVLSPSSTPWLNMIGTGNCSVWFHVSCVWAAFKHLMDEKFQDNSHWIIIRHQSMRTFLKPWLVGLFSVWTYTGELWFSNFDRYHLHILIIILNPILVFLVGTWVSDTVNVLLITVSILSELKHGNKQASQLSWYDQQDSDETWCEYNL